MEQPESDENFSSLAEWAFSESPPVGPIEDKRATLDLPLEQLLPDAEEEIVELQQPDSPEEVAAPDVGAIDVCKLAELSPDEENELGSLLHLEAPSHPQPLQPPVNERKRSFEASTCSSYRPLSQASEGSGSAGDAASESGSAALPTGASPGGLDISLDNVSLTSAGDGETTEEYQRRYQAAQVSARAQLTTHVMSYSLSTTASLEDMKARWRWMMKMPPSFSGHF